jgi:hypothetical protein
MQKLYIVTLFFAANAKVSSIRMLRAFFPSLGLAEAKNAVEKLIGIDNYLLQRSIEVKIAVTAEEYAEYWVSAKRDLYGACRVRNIQPLEIPTFFRPQ